MPIGRCFSQIVAWPRASLPQLWRKCDYAQVARDAVEACGQSRPRLGCRRSGRLFSESFRRSTWD